MAILPEIQVPTYEPYLKRRFNDLQELLNQQTTLLKKLEQQHGLENRVEEKERLKQQIHMAESECDRIQKKLGNLQSTIDAHRYGQVDFFDKLF